MRSEISDNVSDEMILERAPAECRRSIIVRPEPRCNIVISAIKEL